jgi:hypothetical protein
MANAAGAVTAALRPIAAIAVSSTVTPGGNVTLQGAGSAAACGRLIGSHAWTVVASSGAPPGISGANTATATVVAPATGTTTLRLVVTDDRGVQDAADVVLSSNAATTAAPSNAGSTACRALIVVPSQRASVSVTAGDASAAEPGSDTGAFTVSRSGDVSAALVVNVTIGGTATAGTDYQALATSLSLPAGQASAAVLVTPIDDTLVESAETVSLSIAPDANYDVGSPNSAAVTINDNDVAPPPPPPVAASASGGGGGLIEGWEIFGLLSMLLWRQGLYCKRTRKRTVNPGEPAPLPGSNTPVGATRRPVTIGSKPAASGAGV